jgi:hypothetical protein
MGCHFALGLCMGSLPDPGLSLTTVIVACLVQQLQVVTWASALPGSGLGFFGPWVSLGLALQTGLLQAWPKTECLGIIRST